jgi:hypothetical protein
LFPPYKPHSFATSALSSFHPNSSISLLHFALFLSPVFSQQSYLRLTIQFFSSTYTHTHTHTHMHMHTHTHTHTHTLHFTLSFILRLTFMRQILTRL